MDLLWIYYSPIMAYGIASIWLYYGFIMGEIYNMAIMWNKLHNHSIWCGCHMPYYGYPMYSYGGANEFIMPLMSVIQQLIKRVEALENQIGK